MLFATNNFFSAKAAIEVEFGAAGAKNRHQFMPGKKIQPFIPTGCQGSMNIRHTAAENQQALPSNSPYVVPPEVNLDISGRYLSRRVKTIRRGKGTLREW